MTEKHTKSRLALFSALALVTLVPSLSHATGFAESKHFDLSPGNAAIRLNDFAAQSGIKVVYPYIEMRGIAITPVHGSYKPLDALDQMLSGTRIHYVVIESRIVVLVPEPVQSAVEPRASLDIRAKTRAPVDRRSPNSAMEEVTIRSTLPESHVLQSSSPLFTLSRDDIDATGFTTVQDVIRTLPQIFGGGPTEDTTSIGAEALSNKLRGSGINLRGLGAGSTLVLVNGMRQAGSGIAGTFSDVSNLPLAAVERIDILPDSSSTYYGADAVGGVVNFVMRDRFNGVQTEAHYGTATRGAPQEFYVSQIAGGQGEKSHGLVVFDFYSRDSVAASSRPQARSDLRVFGGSNFDMLHANPANILIGPFTWAIPRGQNGTDLSAVDLLPGTVNLANRYEGADLLPSQQRLSVFGSGRYMMNDRFTIFADALLTRRDVRARGGGYTGTFQVPESHPYYVNPTWLPGPVTVTYNFLKDFGSMISDGHVNSVSVLGGLLLKPANDWQLMASLGYAGERLVSTIHNQVDELALRRALNESDPARVFNPFGDGSYTNPAVLEALRASTSVGTRSSIATGNLLASGPVANLQGGDVMLSVGAEARRQTFQSESWSTARALTTVSSFLRPRTIHSAFGELRIPMFSASNGRPGVEALELSLGSRFERYDDIGSKLVSRGGVAWTPVRGVTLRGTYSESFRPPGLLDLDESANFYAVVPLPDPQAGRNDLVLVWGGRNRDLQEENARSWTVGLDVQFPSRGNNSVAITYFDTAFVNRLSQPQFSTNLLSDPLLAPLVTRKPSAAYRAEVCHRAPQAATAASCFNTPVAAIADLRSRNDSILVTRGFDLLARYTQDTWLGRFSLGLNGTYVLDFSEAKTSSLPLEDRVSTPNYPVNLRMHASGGWKRGPVDASVFVNYQNSYLDTLSKPRRHVSSWTTLDLNLSYAFGVGVSVLGDTTVSLGVNNLLDVSPPFLNNAVGIGYDQENGDLIGRVVSFTVRKRW